MIFLCTWNHLQNICKVISNFCRVPFLWEINFKFSHGHFEILAPCLSKKHKPCKCVLQSAWSELSIHLHQSFSSVSSRFNHSHENSTQTAPKVWIELKMYDTATASGSNVPLQIYWTYFSENIWLKYAPVMKLMENCNKNIIMYIKNARTKSRSMDSIVW